MVEVGPPPVFVGDFAAGVVAPGRSLSEPIRLLVAPNSSVCGSPPDDVISAQGSRAHLHDRNSEALAGANGVRPCLVDRGRGV